MSYDEEKNCSIAHQCHSFVQDLFKLLHLQTITATYQLETLRSSRASWATNPRPFVSCCRQCKTVKVTQQVVQIASMVTSATARLWSISLPLSGKSNLPSGKTS